MQDIAYTVMEYKKSAAMLKRRINELNGQLRDAGDNTGGYKKRLLERRGILYTELSDMQYAIRELLEYQLAVAKRETNIAG